MSATTQIKTMYNGLRPVQKRIADYFLGADFDALDASIEKVASKSGTSVASISRFCKKLGYESFGQFKITMSRDMKYEPDTVLPIFRMDDDPDLSIRKVFSEAITNLQATQGTVDFGAIKAAAARILKSDIVYLFGLGGSGGVGVPRRAPLHPHREEGGVGVRRVHDDRLGGARERKDGDRRAVTLGEDEARVDAVRIGRKKGAFTAGITNYAVVAPRLVGGRSASHRLPRAEDARRAVRLHGLPAHDHQGRSTCSPRPEAAKKRRGTSTTSSGTCRGLIRVPAANEDTLELTLRRRTTFMERIHDPIIFQHAVDGIDMKNHIVATYYMTDRLPGVDFIDHFALIESIAIEGSTGSWQRVQEESEEVRAMLSGKLVGYYEVPSDDEYRKSAVIQLAFPINAWHDNVPMMLLSIAGNCFAYSQHMRLLDVVFPENMVKNFKGPKFGVEGTRELLKIKDRPLSLHIIKPKMGMTPKQTGDQVYQTAIGGADMAKDDEMTSDTYNNDFRDRLKYVMDAIDRASKKTGKRMIYFCSHHRRGLQAPRQGPRGGRARSERPPDHLLGRASQRYGM